jgi:hypothetical protein
MYTILEFETRNSLKDVHVTLSIQDPVFWDPVMYITFKHNYVLGLNLDYKLLC